MELDQSIVADLREWARRGERATAMLEMLGQRLQLEGQVSRLQAIAYFQVAFCLPLGEAMRVGAAPVFEPGGRLAQDVDAELGKMLEGCRDKWDR